MSAPIKSCSRWRQTKSGKLVGGNTPPGQPISLRELKTREDWNEWQANVLGAAILMPQREIDLALRTMPEAGNSSAMMELMPIGIRLPLI